MLRTNLPTTVSPVASSFLPTSLRCPPTSIMTVTQRKRQHQPDEIQSAFNSPLRHRFKTAHVSTAVTEPGVQIECDACACDLTHSVRMKCADPVCEPGDGVDICPACFCAGKEFLEHKRWHAYRVVVRSFRLSGSHLISHHGSLSRNSTLTLSSPRTGEQMSECHLVVVSGLTFLIGCQGIAPARGPRNAGDGKLAGYRGTCRHPDQGRGRETLQ